MSTDDQTEMRTRDAAQMTRVATGDDAAFARLHREHYAAVFRLALATVLDRHEAQDVAQEVFVRLHQIADRWEPRARVRTWLHRTTLNVSLSTRRRMTRWLRPRPSLAGTTDDAESTAIADSLRQYVKDELSRLSPRQRAVTSLHLDAELSPSEIAEHLGISANAARVTLHKGLCRLRDAYATDDATAVVSSKEASS